MPAPSPYFDHTYFSPTYFDTDSGATSGGRGGRFRRLVLRRPDPASLEDEELSWIT